MLYSQSGPIKTTLLTGRRNSILSNPSLSDYSSPLNDSYLRDSFNANNSENFNPSCQRSFAVKKKKGLEGSALVVTHLITPIEANDFQRNEGESDFGFSSINEIAKELDMILQLPNEMPEVNSACL